MDKLLDLLKSAAPALATTLATAAGGPLAGKIVGSIAEMIGAEPTVDAVTARLQANPDLALKLREIDVRQFEAEQKAISERWQADMASDSWLSKNIRPMTLVYILTAYLIFAGLSAAGIQVQESYVALLGQWGMLVMTAYFGGRTVEKIAATMKGSK
jgi:hypothetical protein